MTRAGNNQVIDASKAIPVFFEKKSDKVILYDLIIKQLGKDNVSNSGLIDSKILAYEKY